MKALIDKISETQIDLYEDSVKCRESMIQEIDIIAGRKNSNCYAYLATDIIYFEIKSCFPFSFTDNDREIQRLTNILGHTLKQIYEMYENEFEFLTYNLVFRIDSNSWILEIEMVNKMHILCRKETLKSKKITYNSV